MAPLVSCRLFNTILPTDQISPSQRALIAGHQSSRYFPQKYPTSSSRVSGTSPALEQIFPPSTTYDLCALYPAAARHIVPTSNKTDMPWDQNARTFERLYHSLRILPVPSLQEGPISYRFSIIVYGRSRRTCDNILQRASYVAYLSTCRKPVLLQLF